MVAGLDAFFATKPSNTFSKAMEKVSGGLVKNVSKLSKIKIVRRITGSVLLIIFLR